MTNDGFDGYLDRLEELEFVRSAKVRAGPRGAAGDCDAIIELETEGGLIRLRAMVKRARLGSPLLDLVIAQGARLKELWILLAPSISSDMGCRLREAGANYLDLNGNCGINVGGRFVAQIEGRREPRAGRRTRGLGAAGYRVLLAWLMRPDLVGATVREVAEQAGVGRQTVSDMRRRLAHDGWIGEGPSGFTWLRSRLGLLERWLTGYADIVRPGLLHGVYRTRSAEPADVEGDILDALGSPQEGCWRWGGVTAAFRLTGHYRGLRTVIHVENPQPDLPRGIGALPDFHGNLVILRFPGPLSCDGVTPDTPHPLLVYSEATTEADERSREAAAVVLERFVALE